jgi:hypothetical protein
MHIGGKSKIDSVHIFPRAVRRDSTETLAMDNTVPVIGIDPSELAWIRMLVQLLRHPDPVVPELTRQALVYLEGAASRSGVFPPDRQKAEAAER